jgi:hypothetical protein
MDVHTAHLVLYCLTAVALVAWAAGLRFLIASARQPHVAEAFDAPEPSGGLPVQGTAEVDGRPEDLSLRAASIMAKGIAGQLGPMRIVDRTADRVIFEGDPMGVGLGRYIRQGAFHFAASGANRTRIDYALKVSQAKGLLWAGAICQMLGLLAIAIGFFLVRTYVIDNANPAIRAQSVQMVQVSHFLWPPFLFGALYRRGPGALRGAMDTFVRNLPFCEP